MQICAPTSRVVVVLFCFSLVFATNQLKGQESATQANGKATEPAAKNTDASGKAEASPIFEKPSRQAIAELSEKMREFSSAVCLVGTSKTGGGTGFVISKKHRLIATNAHCADLRHPYGELYVIGNDSATVLEVDKVWYHPGVSRLHRTGLIRSSDPAQGKVYTLGPDVAVIHVSGDAELPNEMPLATASEYKHLFAKAVGMIGFPSHDTSGWPAPGDKPLATAREGIIARTTGFNLAGGASDSEKQFLQHTMSSWFGFSGSPIVLPNGHVIGLNNSGRTVRGNMDTTVAYGVRVDCLWELLAYHKLTDKVPVPIDVKELRLERFEKEDPNLTKLNEVIELVAKADEFMAARRYGKAETALKKAIKILPNCAVAHSRLGVCHNDFAVLVMWKEIQEGSDKYTLKDYRERLAMALKESEIALNLDPTNVDYLLDACRERCAVHFAAEDVKEGDYEEIKTIAKKLIDEKSISQEQRAYAWQLLGTAHEKEVDRIPHYKRALELQPQNVGFASDIARAYRNINEDELAKQFEEKLEKLTSAAENVNKMWELATSPDASKRDGSESLRLAREACEATGYVYWNYLECLAAAYAELRNFDAAQDFQAKALLFVPEIERPGTKKRLKLYLDNKPFREAE